MRAPQRASLSSRGRPFFGCRWTLALDDDLAVLRTHQFPALAGCRQAHYSLKPSWSIGFQRHGSFGKLPISFTQNYGRGEQ